jgi:hypothetical protein
MSKANASAKAEAVTDSIGKKILDSIVAIENLRSTRTRISADDDLCPTKPSAGPANERSQPSAFAGKGDKVSAEMLEKPSGGRSTNTSTDDRPQVSTTRIADIDAGIPPAASKNKQRLLRKGTARGLVRFLVIFAMGVVTTLGWQAHGDEIRDTIANLSPQLGWMAPQAAIAKTAPEITPPAPATTSPEKQEFEVMSLSLVTMQQSIDQLSNQFLASQQQMASDIAQLKQDILGKIGSAPRPVAAPVRKSAPVAPPQSLLEPLEH